MMCVWPQHDVRLAPHFHLFLSPNENYVRIIGTGYLPRYYNTNIITKDVLEKRNKSKAKRVKNRRQKK
jgi:hypothetical protein